jgi:hypothetical protein
MGLIMRPVDIINSSDSKSKSKAKSQNISARLYKVENNSIQYTVNSSSGDKQYLVTIQLLDLTGNRLRSLKAALNGNIKISCTCDAFLYQGWKYISYKRNAGINKETRSPDIRNPEKKGIACKHIIVALDQMKSDYNAIYNMIKSQVDKGKQSKPADTKNNYKSTEPTEIDIDIVTDFKSACDKLYKDYTNYIKSRSDEPFIDSKFYDGNDPSSLLKNLSKPVLKSLSGKFIGKLTSLDNILSLIDQKKNGFNVLLDSDTQSIIKKLNSTVKFTTESIINDIILNLICS